MMGDRSKINQYLHPIPGRQNSLPRRASFKSVTRVGRPKWGFSGITREKDGEWRLQLIQKKAPVSWDIDDIDDMMAQWIADGKGCNETQPQWKYHGMFHGIFSGRHKQHLLSGTTPIE